MTDVVSSRSLLCSVRSGEAMRTVPRSLQQRLEVHAWEDVLLEVIEGTSRYVLGSKIWLEGLTWNPAVLEFAEHKLVVSRQERL